MLFGLACLIPAARAESVHVFAAASLKTALDVVGERWKASARKDITMVYAGSASLAKQIAEGAPADLFISADLAWMDDLQSRGLIRPETRRNLLGNTLVLIAPADSVADFARPVDLAKLLNGGKLAVADVNSVPAGRYARSALETLGLWASVQSNLAQADNVRAALAFVARGEAPLGIVYGSDAMAEPKVRVLAQFPPGSHLPIVYPVALVAASTNANAAAFLQFLLSPEAGKIFATNGFTPLPETPQ
jgi:molybdate transport system substrate-binding protein